MLSPKHLLNPEPVPAAAPHPSRPSPTPPSKAALAHQPSVPDMPGIKAQHELAQTMRREVADLLGRKTLAFPGAQPVSFARRHLEELRRRDYYVCEKSDGIRCLLYFTQDETGKEIHYLIDRKNDYYFVPHLHFPKAGDDSFKGFHIETLIDGELVLDKVPNGRRILRYLVFDCLIMDNKGLMERPLDKRLAYFKEFVYNPYKKLCQTFPDEVPYFPFQIEMKSMQFSYGIEMMFRTILPKLAHGNDGLIFTCRETGYTCGTDQNIIKWKPAEENSVDFRLKLEFQTVRREDLDPEDVDSDTESVFEDFEAMPKFNLMVNKGNATYEKWAEMHVTPEEWEEFKRLGQPLDEEIVECAMDADKRWVFLRFRRDKKDGNHISTVESVMESIYDGVSQDDLLKNAKATRDAWKARQERRNGAQQPQQQPR